MVQDGPLSGSPEAADEAELRDLLAACSANRAAFERLYELTHRRVFGLCLAIVGEETTAEDVTLEVYSQIWRQAGSFDPLRGAVWTWIFWITRTRALDAVRGRSRLAQRFMPADAWADVPSPDPDPAARCLHEETATVVRTLVAELPPGQRNAIETAFFHGLSYSETADALGQPVGTIKTRVRAGLATLRRSFQARQREFR
jgi:RNA polymerase sigma-70 factor, ECF subfamily